MASKYYNPRLAASLGAAYTEPYISASEGVERGVRRYERMRAIDIKARAAKAAEWQKQYSQSMDDWIKYNVVTRVAPIPFNIVSYFWGTTEIDIWVYIIATCAVEVIKIVVECVLVYVGTMVWKRDHVAMLILQSIIIAIRNVYVNVKMVEN